MTGPAAPPVAELIAPAAWRAVELISDLHLQKSEPATFELWRHYLENTQADAVLILGDLFEVWVGDDAADEPGFERDCGAVLRACAAQRAVYFMPGNRDFLLGPAFLARCGVQALADPTVLSLAGQRWLLSHGDALCLADLSYQNFRTQVRNPTWQREFLARPLADRQAFARGLRQQSQAHQRATRPEDYADVDAPAARQWLARAQAQVLIHGHTHKPANHSLSDASDPHTANLWRVVLSDWDGAATPARAQVLHVSAAGLHRRSAV